MKCIISPAKKMRRDVDFMEPKGLPVFLEKAERLQAYLQGLSLRELQGLLGCNDAIAERSFREYRYMELRRGLTPALLAYDGIQYAYMAPDVFSTAAFKYVETHLRILSGLYGLLRPFDGVAPYRLEMQAKLRTDFCDGLYDYWGDLLFREMTRDDRVIVNLASAEYSRAVEKYLTADVRYITCRFGKVEAGRFREKGVHVKMARGQMVRFLAETGAEEPEAVQKFDRMGYVFSESLSDEKEYYFLREG